MKERVRIIPFSKADLLAVGVEIGTADKSVTGYPNNPAILAKEREMTRANHEAWSAVGIRAAQTRRLRANSC